MMVEFKARMVIRDKVYPIGSRVEISDLPFPESNVCLGRGIIEEIVEKEKVERKKNGRRNR